MRTAAPRNATFACASIGRSRHCGPVHRTRAGAPTWWPRSISRSPRIWTGSTAPWVVHTAGAVVLVDHSSDVLTRQPLSTDSGATLAIQPCCGSAEQGRKAHESRTSAPSQRHRGTRQATTRPPIPRGRAVPALLPSHVGEFTEAECAQHPSGGHRRGFALGAPGLILSTWSSGSVAGRRKDRLLDRNGTFAPRIHIGPAPMMIGEVRLFMRWQRCTHATSSADQWLRFGRKHR